MKRYENTDLRKLENLGIMFDDALTIPSGVLLKFQTQQEMQAFRQRLYRYRRAFEAQTKDYTYRDVLVYGEGYGDIWRLLLIKKSTCHY